MDEYYASMVVDWLREMAHNNYTDIRKMIFLDAILDIRERAETGLANFFRDKRNEAVSPEPSAEIKYITNCSCSNCGVQLIREDKFCRCCGRPIKWDL